MGIGVSIQSIDPEKYDWVIGNPTALSEYISVLSILGDPNTNDLEHFEHLQEQELVSCDGIINFGDK